MDKEDPVHETVDLGIPSWIDVRAGCNGFIELILEGDRYTLLPITAVELARDTCVALVELSRRERGR
jgi:hypothetical protein